ncbi:MAG: molybdopterin-dependent oxidoreductase [Candidatus Bathyarchaeota archaeon]
MSLLSAKTVTRPRIRWRASWGEAILAYRLDGKDLEDELGDPLRLFVQDKYAYKSAMWLKRIKFISKRELGYWESKGYSDSADVWKNDRFSRWRL